jgi:hypothetical protein
MGWRQQSRLYQIPCQNDLNYYALEQIEKTTPHKDPGIRARFIDFLRKAVLK